MRFSLRTGKRAIHPSSPPLLAMVWVVGFAAVGCGSTPERMDMPPDNVNVQFTEMTLEPTVAHVPPGGNIVWITEATEYTGAVLFPASIKSSFTCADLRPMFAEINTGYVSQPISNMTENVNLPCPLKPGSYDYELILYEPNFGGVSDPVRRLKGTIVAQ